MQRKLAEHQHDARQESPSRSPKLDDRYGKIGIPAVAAAVRCRAQARKSDRGRFVPQDCD